MEILGLITARGGSKSIPEKNVKLLAGKPLIVWTIEVALQCQDLTRVIVSTDDEHIARLARQWGAEVPFIRPVELAGDTSSHISVVSHAIQWMEKKEGYCPEYIMLLQPTSPFRTVEDLRQSINFAKEHHAVAVVSVCVAKNHPLLCKRISEDGRLADFVSTGINYLQRQVLPPAYALNGAIYLNQCVSLLRDQTFVPQGALAYVMPGERSLDIDTEWDWHLAELIMKDRCGNY